MKTRLDPVRNIPGWCVIIRALWCRGIHQQDALNELQRRGLWLSEQQRKQAGLA